MENKLIPFEKVIGTEIQQTGKYLILGEPATGKSLLSLQYTQSVITQHKSVLYISFKKKENRVDSLFKKESKKFHYKVFPLGKSVGMGNIESLIKDYDPSYVIMDDIHTAVISWSNDETNRFLHLLSSFHVGILCTSLPYHFYHGSEFVLRNLADLSDGLIDLRYIMLQNKMNLWIWIPKHGEMVKYTGGQFATITNRGIQKLDVQPVQEEQKEIFPKPLSDRKPLLVMPEIIYNSNLQEKKYRKIIENFSEANPSIPVRLSNKHVHSFLEFRQLLEQLEEGKSTFSTLPIPLFRLPVYIEKDLLYPLDDYFSESLQEKFLDISIEQCKYRGRIYAIPQNLNVGIMAYRKDILDRMSYTPPQTWSECIETSHEILKKLKDPEMSGFGFAGAPFEMLSCVFLEFLWSNGGNIFDASGHLVINSPRVYESLKYMHDLMYKYSISPRNIPFMMESNMDQMFLRGQLLFSRAWPRILSQVESPLSSVSNRVGISPLPTGYHHPHSVPLVAAFGYVIPKTVSDPEQVWKLLSNLIEEKNARELALYDWPCPTQKFLYEHPDILSVRPYYKDILGLLKQGRLRQDIPNYHTLSTLIRREINLVLRDEKEPQTALDNISHEFHKTLHRQLHMVPIQNAIDYIQSHLKEPLTRDSVAKQIGISPSHFSYLFKEVTSKPFSDYLLESRIKKAVQLLSQVEYNISQVAQESGFSNESYFSYVFKRFYGITPSHYRLNLQGNIRSIVT